MLQGLGVILCRHSVLYRPVRPTGKLKHVQLTLDKWLQTSRSQSNRPVAIQTDNIRFKTCRDIV